MLGRQEQRTEGRIRDKKKEREGDSGRRVYADIMTVAL